MTQEEIKNYKIQSEAFVWMWVASWFLGIWVFHWQLFLTGLFAITLAYFSNPEVINRKKEDK